MWYDIIVYYGKKGEIGLKLEQDRFDHFYHLLSGSLKSIQKLKVLGMLPFGLTGAHTMCLRHLYNSPDGLTRSEIVSLCDIDKAQVSRVINELCAKGYVLETDGENINYKKRLKLTPIGKDTTEKINGLVRDISCFVSSDIPEEELSIFYKTLEAISQRLESAQDLIKNR